MKNTIKAYSYEELVALLKDLNHPKFRADQLVQWLYKQGEHKYQNMTNLPQMLRDILEEQFPIGAPSILNQQTSFDRTRKYVLSYQDGAQCETVAIPSFSSTSAPVKQNTGQHPHAPAPKSSKDLSARSHQISLNTPFSAETLNNHYADKNTSTSDINNNERPLDSSEKTSWDKRLTVCVSTQVGCAMKCSFCATGKEGFTRNLLPGEIVDQALVAQKDMNMRVSNVVTMGQGEPFLNYNNTLAALRFINSPKGMAIGARHITISTCGITKGIQRLSEEPEQFTLAVSLHSAEQKVRDILMPRVANEPLVKLKNSLLDYTKRTNRRISLEYIMIKGVTDTPKALKALLAFCENLLCHVNLLPINTVAGSNYTPSSSTAPWQEKLEQAHIPVSTRNSRGSDISGACGQLKNSL